MKPAHYSLIIVVVILSLTGCKSAKTVQAKRDLLYLNQGQLDTLPNLSVPLKAAVIQKGDLLGITVYSDNQDATAVYNRYGVANETKIGSQITLGSSSSTGSPASYLVDQTGNIRFHSLGNIYVSGMTRLQLMDTLSKQLSKFLLNPYTDVRFLNSRITILGEVQRPGVFSVPGDKVSILELIGMAGDITIYGRKENVLVIRESNGKREFGRLDLRQSSVFQSPYFYLQQGDLVMVEPSAKKPTATEQENMRKLTMVTAFATLASTLAILINVF